MSSAFVLSTTFPKRDKETETRKRNDHYFGLQKCVRRVKSGVADNCSCAAHQRKSGEMFLRFHYVQVTHRHRMAGWYRQLFFIESLSINLVAFVLWGNMVSLNVVRFR